jgi:predicted AAA+ superfamily ATPase
MHPFTVAETVYHDLPNPEKIIRSPKQVDKDDFAALWTHGGYPEPFIKRDIRFSRRWRNLRLQQLLREDIRDLTQIHQLDQLEIMVKLLISHSGHQLIYSNLASEIQVSVDTVRRWITTLCNLHLGFLVRPWFRNVSRSLRKEPKWFLRDWSVIDDTGSKAETFIACHLLKAVEGWNDLGLGTFQLCYLRDKNQREIDFVVIQNNKPWFLVEVKNADNAVSPSLKYYQEQTRAPYAFQVVVEADYVEKDCFTVCDRPVIVPARTFLSQLL